MALGGQAMANIADFVWREYLRMEAESAEAWRKFCECQAAVARGEMTERIEWSDAGDLRYVFEAKGGVAS